MEDQSIYWQLCVSTRRQLLLSCNESTIMYYYHSMRSLLTIQITGDDFISSQTYERLEEDYRHVGYNQGIIHVVLDNSRG